MGLAIQLLPYWPCFLAFFILKTETKIVFSMTIKVACTYIFYCTIPKLRKHAELALYVAHDITSHALIFGDNAM